MEMPHSTPRRIVDMDATDEGPDTADETNTTLQEVREMWANGEPSEVARQTEDRPDLQVSGKIGTVPGFYVESTHLTVSGRGVMGWALAPQRRPIRS